MRYAAPQTRDEDDSAVSVWASCGGCEYTWGIGLCLALGEGVHELGHSTSPRTAARSRLLPVLGALGCRDGQCWLYVRRWSELGRFGLAYLACQNRRT